MGDALFRDFDQAWAEQARDAPAFKAFGRHFTLPKSPPVKLTLQAMRAAQQGGLDQQASPEAVLDMAALLVGRDTVKELVDAGLTMEQLGDVIRFAHDAYRQQQDDGDGDADDPPVTGGQDEPSSPTGEPSKPTSSASTDWI